MRYFKLTIYLFAFLAVLTVGQFAHAQYWVDDPADCPQSYSGQNCTPDVVCGITGGTSAQCYNTGLMAPPSNANSTSQYSGSFGGGWLINCYAVSDAAAPYCDNSANWWCNRDSSCYDVNRETVCPTATLGSFSCGDCVSGYTYCDGSYIDGDGCEVQSGATNCALGAHNNINSGCTCVCDTGYLDCDSSGAGAGTGCEVQDGGACTIGGLPGTYTGCNCVIDTQDFVTGTETKYATSTPLLWGTQYGDGPLMKL